MSQNLVASNYTCIKLGNEAYLRKCGYRSADYYMYHISHMTWHVYRNITDL